MKPKIKRTELRLDTLDPVEDRIVIFSGGRVIADSVGATVVKDSKSRLIYLIPSRDVRHQNLTRERLGQPEIILHGGHLTKSAEEGGRGTIANKQAVGGYAVDGHIHIAFDPTQVETFHRIPSFRSPMLVSQAADVAVGAAAHPGSSAI